MGGGSRTSGPGAGECRRTGHSSERIRCFHLAEEVDRGVPCSDYVRQGHLGLLLQLQQNCLGHSKHAGQVTGTPTCFLSQEVGWVPGLTAVSWTKLLGCESVLARCSEAGHWCISP